MDGKWQSHEQGINRQGRRTGEDQPISQGYAQ